MKYTSPIGGRLIKLPAPHPSYATLVLTVYTIDQPQYPKPCFLTTREGGMIPGMFVPLGNGLGLDWLYT